MKTNDRTMYRVAAVVDYGVASLTTASVVLRWSVAVQYTFLVLLVLVTSAERVAASRRRR